jgi:hypothetical protein
MLKATHHVAERAASRITPLPLSATNDSTR